MTANDSDGIRVAVPGATGRTGGHVVDVARDRGHAVVPLSRTPTGDQRDIADLRAILDDGSVDALVDFTVPGATVEHVDAAAEAGVPAIVGTTGFDDDEFDALLAASERTPVLRAANFGRGLMALRRAIRAAVESVPGYDVELTDTHHAGKLDAPSGTARRILDDIEAARDGPSDRVYGREEEHDRTAEEIGVHVRRAGTVRGGHEVLLADNDEVVTLSHRAESRRVYAAGALDATVWLIGRDPGFYDFEDVIDS